MILQSHDGKHTVNGNVLTFVASREDAGEFVCSSGGMSKVFNLQIIGETYSYFIWVTFHNSGPDDEIYKGEVAADVVEESNSYKITLSLMCVLFLVL